MIKKILTVFILTAVMSCSKQRIIPDRILVEIIYRMQLTDAVLFTRESYILHKDSMRIYEPEIEKFGYTLDDLRRTFLKCAAENNKLQSILNQVIDKIAAEKEVHKGPARIEKLSENMNTGPDSVSIVSKTVNRHNIEVVLSEQGVYDVSASYFFYRNDSTKNPKMAVWLESRSYKDSIVDRQETDLVKDTVFADYSIRVKFNNPSFNILKIYWIDFEQESGLSKPETPAPLPARPANARIAKRTNIRTKPDTVTRQHLIIKNKSVKYNFEESDTTRLKKEDEFIGPPLPDSLWKNRTADSVTNAADTVERIIAIKRKDSILHEK